MPHIKALHREVSNNILVKRALSTDAEVQERISNILLGVETLKVPGRTRHDTLNTMASFVKPNHNDRSIPANGQFWRLKGLFTLMREKEEREIREKFGERESKRYRNAAKHFETLSESVFWNQWSKEVKHPPKLSDTETSPQKQRPGPGGPDRNTHTPRTSETVQGLKGPRTRGRKSTGGKSSVTVSKMQNNRFKGPKS
ncbi:hypothetical protein MMC10_005488 [Thelotrema lepadinum]|nr:hypothetical protein [Thelotrema lepadinum]